MSTLELRLQEAITDAFIAADPVLLDIYRPQRVGDGAGGRVDGPAARVASGAFRIIPQSRNSTETVATTAAGSHETPRYVIMCNNDFAFERGDYFTWRGFEYTVSAVHEFPAYESKADIVRGKKVA